ncbi:MAG: antitoxin YefM [Alteromonadaceae bacterium]
MFLARLVLFTVQLREEDNMRIVSFTEARNGLKSVLDHVVNDVDYTVITRRDSEDAVVMSLDYYNSLMETVHLLKSPANAVHLSRSIEQYKSSQVIEREVLND